MAKGTAGAWSLTWPLACRDVEPAVVVDVEERQAEAEHDAASGPPGRDRRDRSTNRPLAQVLIEGRRFAVEVGDGQVEPAVAVEVAAGDAHAGLVAAARRWPRRPRRQPHLVELGSRPGCGTGKFAVMSLATNRSSRPSSSRSAATTPRPRPSRSMDPALSRRRRRTGRRRCERRGPGRARTSRGPQIRRYDPARLVAARLRGQRVSQAQ